MNNLYLITGENKTLIDFYLSNILKKITYIAENKITYDMSSYTLKDILDEASTISLFSSVKVIIGNNFDISKIDESTHTYLEKYINNKNKDIYIILIAPKIDARVKNYQIFKNNFNIIDVNKEDNSILLLDYVSNTIKEKGYKIEKYNIEYFIDRVGNDIFNIDSELSKIFIYKDKDKTITKEDIDTLTIDTFDNVIYEFTNAILENDIDTIKKMYDNFKKENISIDYLISSIYNTLRQVLIIKLLSKDKKTNLEISKIIGKKEFYVKKMQERTYQYSIKDISNYIKKLAKIDLDYKSGKSNTDMLELFLYTK